MILMALRHLELHLAVATVMALLVLVHGDTDPKDGTLLESKGWTYSKDYFCAVTYREHQIQI